MPLTKEQISNLKKQLLEQVKNIPESQRIEAEKQIQELSDEAIESMLETQKESQVKIFREIASEKIPSKKISESETAIAVLDIKPISKGHTIIIPKERIENTDKISKNILDFAQETAKKLSNKLKTPNIKIIPEIKFNEAVINLIPIYDEDLSLKSERLNPSEESLEKTLEEIKKPDEIKKVEIKKEKKELKKFPRRIP